VKILISKAGKQFVETAVPGGSGAQFAAAPAYDSWAFLEKRLKEGGASPQEIARVKAEFESGKESTSIDVA